MNIHALWCHPRSVSTAFERIMRERGDLDVLHEPFMYYYYFTLTDRLFPNFTPIPGHPKTYTDIRDMILERARSHPIFIKEMAFYANHALQDDPEFLHAMSHSFLVRDPAESIVSYYRRDPDFTRTEMGIEAQWLLYERLVQNGQTPLVVTADQLRRAPEKTLSRYWTHVGLPFCPHAFGWDDAVPEGWESVADWHSDVLGSGAIQPPSTDRDYSAELQALGSPYTDYHTHHQPFYDRLLAVAQRQLDGCT